MDISKPTTVSDEEHLRAQGRAAEIENRFDGKIARRWLTLAKQESKPAKKIVWLRKMADTLATVAGDIAACKDGCDHCCHIPVLMTLTEARTIASETGAPMKMPARWTYDGNLSYTGTACPFLDDHRCSIYEHRPFACRVLYSLADDDTMCRLVDAGKETPKVPYLDPMPFHLAFVKTLGDQSLEVADIREFF